MEAIAPATTPLRSPIATSRLRFSLIPWAMAITRALLGLLLILGARTTWNPLALATIVVVALVSDIFDGILARRWHCDTPAVRLCDTLADTAFYLCTAYALWLVQPTLWTLRTPNGILLATLLSLEAIRLAFDFIKFGKPASYHSYLAKTWGLVMALAVIVTLASSHVSALIPVSLAMGIACDLEGLAMSAILPAWCNDVKTLRAAWLLRTAQTSSTSCAPSTFR